MNSTINTSVFQSPQFFSVLQATGEFEPFAIQEQIKGEVVGSLQGYVTKDKNPVKNLLTRRAIIFGNPVIEDGDKGTLQSMLSKVRESLAGRAIYIEFRNLSDQHEYHEIYSNSGFEFEEHLDIHVDLTKSIDELWENIYSKRRNEIRRATKEGTVFKVVNDVESLRACYTILEEVYHRAKLPLPKFEYFYNLYEQLIGEAAFHIFTAQHEGEIIGCMLALGYNGVLYDYYAGAKYDFYKKHPNDLIPWEVFQWAKNNGYRLFDFGGAGKPNIPYKVRDYKKQFGGTLVNYGRYKLILNRPLYKLGAAGIKLLKKYG
jgi:lipid II:glycine glycyltransferase (peptidoglycan interpeptide bridge formation enzyme)